MNLEDLIEDFDPEAQQSPWTQVTRSTEMNATKQILRNARILFNTGCYSVTQAIEDGSNGFRLRRSQGYLCEPHSTQGPDRVQQRYRNQCLVQQPSNELP